MTELGNITTANINDLPSVPIGVCAVYFLIDERGEVVYVGKSKSVAARTSNHNHRGYVVRYKEVPNNADLDRLESYYIAKFQPRLNKRGKTAIATLLPVSQSGSIEIRLPANVTARQLIDCGMARRTAYRVMSNPSRIDLRTLTILCRALKRRPGEIMALPGDLM